MALNRTYTLDQIRTRMINLGLQNLTAAELIENFQKMEDESEQRINDRSKARDEWYRNCIGRCFLIDFNGTSFAAYRINNDPVLTNQMEGVRICISRPGSDMGTRIEYNKKDAFNRFWLQNPYDDNGKFGGYSGINGVREITDKEFDELIATYDKVNKILEDVVK